MDAEYKKMQVKLEVRSYIGNPYWPEMEQVISIQKQSGMNLCRSQDKRAAALSRYLEKIGLSAADYAALEKLAARPWYMDGDGHIVIPRHQLSGCLVQAVKSAPAGCRFPQDQLRSLLQISDFTTTKKDSDTQFKRYILPTDGKGNPISNQRRYTCSEVIEDFTATGTISFDVNDVKEKAVRELLNHAGKYIGVGASRKMGYGRFKVALPASKVTE